MLGRFASPLPLSRFSRLRDQCFLAHRSLSLSWGRSLVTAFRSPVTAAPSQKPPFQGQRSRPATSPPSTRPRHPFGPSARQPPDLGARLPATAASTPKARCGSFPCGPACRSCDLHSPSGDFRLPQDQSVQPLLLPASPPDEIARLPLAPRHRVYF